MKKLLVIVVFFWGQNSLATENQDDKAIVTDFEALLELNAIPRDIYGLLEQHDITGAYTKAGELKTREDDVALSNKCFLAVLLRTFPDEEASQYALISGIGKDMPYERTVVEDSFEYLLALHHRWILRGCFESGMKAKAACKFLLGQYPDYAYPVGEAPLTFSVIAENAQTTDSMGRELLGIRNLWFFYPNDEEKAGKIKDYEEMVCREEDEYEYTCISD